MSAYKILCGLLYDGILDELRPNMEILVSGDKIRQVGRDVSAPADAQVRVVVGPEKDV